MTSTQAATATESSKYASVGVVFQNPSLCMYKDNLKLQRCTHTPLTGSTYVQIFTYIQHVQWYTGLLMHTKCITKKSQVAYDAIEKHGMSYRYL